MRKTQQKVFEFQNDLVNEIKDWFVGKEFEQIEFKKNVKVLAEVDVYFGETGYANFPVNFLTSDGFVLDGEGVELNLTELGPFELAYILDEIYEGNYLIS